MALRCTALHCIVGVLDLVESGVVDGHYKHTHPRKLVATFLIGSRKLYASHRIASHRIASDLLCSAPRLPLHCTALHCIRRSLFAVLT